MIILFYHDYALNARKPTFLFQNNSFKTENLDILEKKEYTIFYEFDRTDCGVYYKKMKFIKP